MLLAQDDLVGVVTAIWDQVLELPLAELSPDAAEDLLDGRPTMTACVNITGGWEGSVSIVATTPLAVELASRMLGVADASLDLALVRDAFGELVNIAGGNAKGMLDEACGLGLPVVADGLEYRINVAGAEVACVAAFDCLGQPLVVTLHQRSPY